MSWLNQRSVANWIPGELRKSRIKYFWYIEKHLYEGVDRKRSSKKCILFTKTWFLLHETIQWSIYWTWWMELLHLLFIPSSHNREQSTWRLWKKKFKKTEIFVPYLSFAFGSVSWKENASFLDIALTQPSENGFQQRSTKSWNGLHLFNAVIFAFLRLQLISNICCGLLDGMYLWGQTTFIICNTKTSNDHYPIASITVLPGYITVLYILVAFDILRGHIIPPISPYFSFKKRKYFAPPPVF